MVERTTPMAPSMALCPAGRRPRLRRAAILGACLALVSVAPGCGSTGDARCALTGNCPSPSPRVASSAPSQDRSQSQTVHFRDVNYSILTTAGGRTKVSVGTDLTTDRTGDRARYVFNHAVRMEQTLTKGPTVFGALKFTVLAHYPRAGTACDLPGAVVDKTGCWLSAGTVAPFQDAFVPGYAGRVPEPLSYLSTGEPTTMTLPAGAPNPLARPTRIVVIHSTLDDTPATIAFPGQCTYTPHGSYGPAPTAVRPVSPASDAPTGTPEPTHGPQTVRFGAFPGTCKGLPTPLIGS